MTRSATFRAALLSVALILAGMLATEARADAAGVRVDRSFGVRGVAEPTLEPVYGHGSFTSIAPQADGSIVAGRRGDREGSEYPVRFDATGHLLVGPGAETIPSQPEARQPDGKVVKLATGESLERVDADGSPDPTFGTQPFGSGRSSDYVDFAIEAIVVQPSGDILVAGTKSHNVQEGEPPEPVQEVEQLSVARFDPTGRLDPTFGHGGVVHLNSDLGFAGERLVGLVSRPGGGAVVIDEDAVLPSSAPTYDAPGSYLLGLDAAGGLDPAYGSGGEVRLAAAITRFEPLPEEGLLVAGDLWGPVVAGTHVHESDLFLARYGDDGRPDPSFGGGAPALAADFGGIDLLGSMAVEADGAILLGGSSTAPTPSCLDLWNFCTETPVVERFAPTGQPDPGFGTGGRLVLSGLTQSHAGIEGFGVQALASRPGGGVLAGGGSGPFAFLAAVTPSGALDPAFGTAGIATYSEPKPSSSGAHLVAVDPEGRIVIGGGTNAGLSLAGSEGAVFRLLPDGALDRSFGGGTGFARGPRDVDQIALSGSSVYALSKIESAVFRFTPAGLPDPAFGREGTEAVSLGRAYVSLLAASRGGGFVLAGTGSGAHAHAVVGRFSKTGARDRSFGRAGVATLAFGYRHRCGAEALAVEPDGKVLVAGYVDARPGGRSRTRLAVIRLSADGDVDRSFGDGGIFSLGAGTEALATAIAVGLHGEIVVGGHSRTGKRDRELLLRLDSRGRPVKAFAHDGVSSTPAPLEANGRPSRNAAPLQILIRPHGYLVLRTGSVQPLVAYGRRGRLDPRFAAGVVALEGREYGRPGAALQGDRLLVVRGRSKPKTLQVQRLLLGPPSP